MTLPFQTHNSLSLPHGFFGRQGGVSAAPYDSLNAGLGSSDDKDNVAENRDRIRTALNADYMVSLKQVHSTEVVIAADTPVSDEEADGLVTTVPGLAIAVLSADCGPVLFCDTKAGVVAACHAGWRGALDGIVESTVATMCEMGASPADISAVLGPCIGPDSYEVGPDFRDEFLDVDESYTQFFNTPTGKKAHFDLPAFILSRLDVLGVGQSAWTGEDTYALPAQYFSYRYNTHQGINVYGRNLSAIMLPPSMDS